MADNPPNGPVFGFLLLGGPLSGAMIRDIRLANELKARGYGVHVWWAMERSATTPLRPDIPQRWLFNGLRYTSWPGFAGPGEAAGRLMTRYFHEKNRLRHAQKRPAILRRVMEGLARRVCASVEGDRRLLKRFGHELDAAGVTHVLPMLGILCPFAQAARAHVGHRLRYLVTFQGYELYVNFAKAIHCEQQVYERLQETVRESDWPAIAVSEDYLERVVEDIGVPRESLRAIPPGIPTDVTYDRAQAPEQIAAGFVGYRPGVPLVTFLGRRDAEKGIDLLLYAASILRQRGLDFQLAVCGPTLFGDHYGRVCRQLATDLRCPVLWRNQVPDELRSALFSGSRFIVYPSIHREPFGMVAVEAMAHGTPAIVHARGGGHAPLEKPYGMSLTSLAPGCAGKTIWSTPLKQFSPVFSNHWDAESVYAFRGGKHIVLSTNTGKIVREQPLYDSAELWKFDVSKNDWIHKSGARVKAGKKSHPNTNHANIVVGDWHYFLAHDVHYIGRVHVRLGRVEYLEVPAQLVADAHDRAKDRRLWGTGLQNRPTNAKGLAIGRKGHQGTGFGHISAASPTLVGRYLFFPVVTGTVYVIDTTAERLSPQALVALNDLGPGGKTWTLGSLSFSNGRLFAHTMREIVCIGPK